MNIISTFIITLIQHIPVLSEKKTFYYSEDNCSSTSLSSREQNKKTIEFDQLKHTLNNICDAIESITKNEYQFIKHYETYFSYSLPGEITVLSTGEVLECGYFIPIDKTLFSILDSQPFVLEILKNIQQQRIATKYDADLMFSIRDGYHGSRLDHDNLLLQLYLDDIGLTNPLGSKRNQHKMCMIYFSLEDIPEQYRSKIDFIQLVGICEKRMENFKYGYFDTSNRPPPILVKHLQDNRIVATAAQKLCIFKLFPIIFHDIIDHLPSFIVYKILREILDLVLSYPFRNKWLPVLGDLCHTFHQTMLTNFPNKIVPKAHFVREYEQIIHDFGPSTRQWCFSTIFLLCLSDVVHLNKEMTKMKHELADLRNQSIIFNRSSFVDPSNKILLTRKNISGKLCLSYDEQCQILEYINFISNMTILLFGSYSIYVYGIGTHHGLAYRLFFFICKLFTIIASIWLNLHFKKGLPSDIFLYIWIDITCVVSIYRSLRQII
ncbi:unnamed protein product [Rotaria sp. Silwood2]|nr:unnamed protein product [Rotaria sp. Silwood2]